MAGVDGVDYEDDLVDNLDQRFTANGVQWGRSIMFRRWDEAYFNPIHIYWIRTRLKSQPEEVLCVSE